MPNNRSLCGEQREKWTINPSSKSKINLDIFETLGRLFGFAIRSQNYLNLDLPSIIWKTLLNQPIYIDDLEKIDIHTAKHLWDILKS